MSALAEDLDLQLLQEVPYSAAVALEEDPWHHKEVLVVVLPKEEHLEVQPLVVEDFNNNSQYKVLGLVVWEQQEASVQPVHSLVEDLVSPNQEVVDLIQPKLNKVVSVGLKPSEVLVADPLQWDLQLLLPHLEVVVL